MSRLRRMRRATLAYWAIVAVLMFLTFELVGRVHASAQAAMAKHGTTETVWVTRRDVSAGAILRREDVRLTEVPTAFLPQGHATRDVSGQATTVPLVAGEVVLAARLAPSGVRGAAARMPRGSRALAVPIGPGGPLAVEIGDRVDLLATFPPDANSGDEPTFAVAEGAVVVDVSPDDDTVTVAVPAEDAARVAYAVAVGVVTLALAGWG
jgi:Flp pilus assembly protein CpaB